MSSCRAAGQWDNVGGRTLPSRHNMLWFGMEVMVEASSGQLSPEIWMLSTVCCSICRVSDRAFALHRKIALSGRA